MLLDKTQFTAWYLQAKAQYKHDCLVDINSRIVMSNDWVNYHDTYTVNKTGMGTFYELVFKRIWNKINVNTLFGNPLNDYIVLDNRSDNDFKGCDFYYYDDNKEIKIDVKHSNQWLSNWKDELSDDCKKLITKAKSQGAKYLFAFDSLGQLKMFDVDKEELIDQFDNELVYETIQEVKNELLNMTIYDKTLKIY